MWIKLGSQIWTQKHQGKPQRTWAYLHLELSLGFPSLVSLMEEPEGRWERGRGQWPSAGNLLSEQTGLWSLSTFTNVALNQKNWKHLKMIHIDCLVVAVDRKMGISYLDSPLSVHRAVIWCLQGCVLIWSSESSSKLHQIVRSIQKLIPIRERLSAPIVTCHHRYNLPKAEESAYFLKYDIVLSF